jgi:hypothetical protein
VTILSTTVMPAKAGIQACQGWMPAFAGMTDSRGGVFNALAA